MSPVGQIEQVDEEIMQFLHRLKENKHQMAKQKFYTSHAPEEPVSQDHEFKGLTFEGETLEEIRRECDIPPSVPVEFWLTVSHKSGKEFPRIICLPSGRKPKGLLHAWKSISLQLATHEAEALIYWRR